jgi:hypothetical protein
MKRIELIPVLFLVSCTALIVGCSSGGKQPDKNTDTYVHPESKIPFPHTIGELVRTRVIEGSPEYPGTAVEYYLKKNKWEVTISVSVYPAPETKTEKSEAATEGEEKPNVLFERMNDIQQEVLETGADEEHRFIARYDIVTIKGEKPYDGKRAYFRHEDDVFSNVYLFQFGDWFIEYRSVFDRDLEWSEDQFVKDHQWTEGAPE